jgi:hypothetical protein
VTELVVPALLDRDHPELSVRRQCALLSLVHRPAAAADEMDLALMRRIPGPTVPGLAPTWPNRLSIENVRRRLHDRGSGMEDLAAVPRAWRVNALAIDDPFRALGGRSLCDHAAIPSFGVDGPPGAEVEDGDVMIDAQRQHRLAQQVAHDVVAREAAHRAAVLARHDGGARAIDREPGNIGAGSPIGSGTSFLSRRSGR